MSLTQEQTVNIIKLYMNELEHDHNNCIDEAIDKLREYRVSAFESTDECLQDSLGCLQQAIEARSSLWSLKLMLEAIINESDLEEHLSWYSDDRLEEYNLKNLYEAIK